MAKRLKLDKSSIHSPDLSMESKRKNGKVKPDVTELAGIALQAEDLTTSFDAQKMVKLANQMTALAKDTTLSPTARGQIYESCLQAFRNAQQKVIENGISIIKAKTSTIDDDVKDEIRQILRQELQLLVQNPIGQQNDMTKETDQQDQGIECSAESAVIPGSPSTPFQTPLSSRDMSGSSDSHLSNTFTPVADFSLGTDDDKFGETSKPNSTSKKKKRKSVASKSATPLLGNILTEKQKINWNRNRLTFTNIEAKTPLDQYLLDNHKLNSGGYTGNSYAAVIKYLSADQTARKPPANLKNLLFHVYFALKTSVDDFDEMLRKYPNLKETHDMFTVLDAKNWGK